MFMVMSPKRGNYLEIPYHMKLKQYIISYGFFSFNNVYINGRIASANKMFQMFMLFYLVKQISNFDWKLKRKME